MRSIDDARIKSMGDQERELHVATLELLLGQMVRRIGVGRLRKLLNSIADDLAEFEG